MEIVAAGVLNREFLEDLVAQGRTPTIDHKLKGLYPGSEVREQWYWALVPPRKLGPGDVATQKQGVWFLAAEGRPTKSYDYYVIPALARNFVEREILVIQQAQD